MTHSEPGRPDQAGRPARPDQAARPCVRASGPADLLALVPSLLGFHPEDSVVLLTVGPATQPFHARVDLPADADALGPLAAHLTEVAVRGTVSRVAVVLYTRDGVLARTVACALGAELGGAGVDLVCAVRADGSHWWPLDGAGGSDLGAPGTSYDVSSHPLMAQAVVDGTVVLGSRRELADTLVGNDPGETEEVSTRAEAVLSRLAAAAAPRGPDGARDRLRAEAPWVARRVRRFLEDGERLKTGDVARLVAVTTVSVEVRDVAWAEMSQANAARHVDLWRDVVRRAPLHLRAAPAALLGFAAWLSGNGALAWCAVECAQEAEPGYTLAGLLSEALAGAVPPSAWRPLRREQLGLTAS
jgi:hypothetical protein